MSPHGGVENGTEVLWKNSQCSLPWSLCSFPMWALIVPLSVKASSKPSYFLRLSPDLIPPHMYMSLEWGQTPDM